MDRNDIVDYKLLNEEYKIWKKNTPFLYDIVMTHSLEWPTLTVEWMKLKDSSKSKDPTLSTQKASAKEGSQDYYGVLNKIDIRQKINHDGEVHRARVMPQNNNIIATKSPGKTSYVFDITKHPANPLDNTFRPDHKLHGHTLEGYGLAWSPHQQGLLLSGADDSHICLWDIQGASDVDIEAQQIRKGHSTVVEDVAWSHRQANVFGSCGDYGELFLWDARESHQGPVDKNTTSHTNDVNCLSFNPFDEFQLATGSSDKTVALWDLRNLKQPTYFLEGHADGVFQIQWSPFSGNVLASSGADRRLHVWDCSRIGQTQSPEDASEGPAELLFIHGGHSAKISDFSFCATKGQEWLVSSVSEDNILQIWQMADCIHGPANSNVKAETEDSNGRSKRARV